MRLTGVQILALTAGLTQTVPRALRSSLSSMPRVRKTKPYYGKRNKAEGVTDEPMPKSVFVAVHKNGLINAGYPCRPSIHTMAFAG